MQDEQSILQQVETLARQNQWQEAVVLLRKHQRTNPMSAKMLGWLAYCSSRARDYDSALALYQDLQRQQPFETKWCYALGFQYQQKRNGLMPLQPMSTAFLWLLNGSSLS
jgi:Flp pilus assembly protein TadD